MNSDTTKASKDQPLNKSRFDLMVGRSLAGSILLILTISLLTPIIFTGVLMLLVSLFTGTPMKLVGWDQWEGPAGIYGGTVASFAVALAIFSFKGEMETKRTREDQDKEDKKKKEELEIEERGLSAQRDVYLLNREWVQDEIMILKMQGMNRKHILEIIENARRHKPQAKDDTSKLHVAYVCMLAASQAWRNKLGQHTEEVKIPQMMGLNSDNGMIKYGTTRMTLYGYDAAVVQRENLDNRIANLLNGFSSPTLKLFADGDGFAFAQMPTNKKKRNEFAPSYVLGIQGGITNRRLALLILLSNAILEYTKKGHPESVRILADNRTDKVYYSPLVGQYFIGRGAKSSDMKRWGYGLRRPDGLAGKDGAFPSNSKYEPCSIIKQLHGGDAFKFSVSLSEWKEFNDFVNICLSGNSEPMTGDIKKSADISIEFH